MAAGDLEVLIPRVRRAVEGPTVIGSAVSGYTDEQMRYMIADAIAEVIFHAGGDFPHTLTVTERDTTYGAPVNWVVDPPMDDAMATIVTTQAALNVFFVRLLDEKVQESMANEAQSWSWSKSATLIRDQMSQLRSLRDAAIARLKEKGAPLDTYVSFLSVRDATASRAVEPWVGSLVA